MTAGERFATHIHGALAPDGQHLQARTGLPAWPLRHVGAPENQHRAGELAPPVGLVVLQVKRNAPVVEARRSDGFRVAETPQIFRIRFLGNGAVNRCPLLQEKIDLLENWPD